MSSDAMELSRWLAALMGVSLPGLGQNLLRGSDRRVHPPGFIEELSLMI